MKESIDKVRKALSRQDIVSNFTHYRFNDWTISACDGRMTTCAPVDFDISCAVPGKELERFVDKLTTIEKIDVGESSITLKSGRAKSNIKTLSISDYSFTPPGKFWRPVPDGFLESLKIARPFVSDNAVHSFALCACLGEDALYATNNVSIVKVDIVGLGGRGELLPCWAIDYLLSRTDAELLDVQFYPDYAAFRFDDDSWLRTSLINEEFPSIVTKLYEKYEKPKWEISEEWKEAFGLATDLAEDSITVHANKLTGKRGASTIEYEIPETPVPSSVDCTSWSIRYLKPVIDLATHWQPDRFPNASEFWSSSAYGFVVGRRG
jgi:hypothetical protein